MSTRNKALLATLLLSCCALMLHHRVSLLFNPNSHMIGLPRRRLEELLHVRLARSSRYLRVHVLGHERPFGEHINYRMRSPREQCLACGGRHLATGRGAKRGAGEPARGDEHSPSALFLCLALIELRTPWVPWRQWVVLVALTASMQN